LIGATGVKVASLCADWFMEAPLVRASGAELAERLAHLRWIIGRCKAIGIGRITLPFVDASRIEGPADVRAVIEAIGAALPAAEAAGVELHLETALGPAEFAALLGQLDHPLVKANYDSGNSSSLDYNVAEEFAAYGHRIGSIHVKDRVKGGGTVPLGTGNANLPVFFDCLKTIGFRRELILQVARGTPGEETSWIRQTRLAVLEMWNRAKAGAGDPSAVAAAAGSATLEGAGANSATGKESSIETGRAAR
jgi:hexulose-6-phosphate isomerase